MKRNLQLTFWSVAMVLFCMGSVQAQIVGDPVPKAIDTQQFDLDKSPSKLSTDLNELYNRLNQDSRRQSSAKPVLPNRPDKYLQIKGDRIMVDITIKGDSKSAQAELEKIGFKVSAVFGRIISGSLPIRALPQLESAGNIKFAKPAYKPMHQFKPVSMANALKTQMDGVTPVISQGDTAQRSDIARNKYNVNGKGVKVGILSDSYNNLGTADIGVSRGELPGPGNPFGFDKPVQVLRDLSDSSGTDEGRGMAEIIHDVAPGAELAFYSAFEGGEADIALGILKLAEVGCKVITDDFVSLTEPFFQDGIIAQAVDISKKLGATYFSSAGNASRRSYESDYRPSTFSPFGVNNGTAHNFSAPGDSARYALPIFIPTGGLFFTSFQWDQPFLSAGGPGAETDMDIYLVNAQGQIVAGGFDYNIGGDPVEFIIYANNTTSNTFFIYILKYEGPDPGKVKYVDLANSAFYLTTPAIPGILAPALFGHAKAEGAIAVAAAPYTLTPAYGVDTPRVEGFSSLGGVPNYFDKLGNRITPEVRKKPEITSVDGGNTSFFFADSNIDADSIPNFFGTSASAPHAAGVAALMIEAQKLNTITPDQIKGVLSTNTVDMDNPYTPGFDVGFDFRTGTGLIKADAAVQTVRFPNVYVKNLDLTPVCSDNPSATRNWKVFNPNPFEVKARWALTGYPLQTGDLLLPPGESSFSTRTLYLFNRPVSNVVVLEWEDNFGFTRFDMATSTSTKCGSYVLSESNNMNGIAETESNAKVNIAEVFPNPSTGNFRLYLSLAEQQNAGIELYSIEGKLLYKNMVRSNGIVNIDASGYKPGVYILKVQQGQFTKTLNLLKK